jgi:hypothetical protein
MTRQHIQDRKEGILMTSSPEGNIIEPSTGEEVW